MSYGRPSSLAVIKTKNERGSRKKVLCYFKVTYFVKNSGVRKKPAAYTITHSLLCNKILVCENKAGQHPNKKRRHCNAFYYPRQTTLFCKNHFFALFYFFCCLFKAGCSYFHFLDEI